MELLVTILKTKERRKRKTVINRTTKGLRRLQRRKRLPNLRRSRSLYFPDKIWLYLNWS
jgi:hypothetical protein